MVRYGMEFIDMAQRGAKPRQIGVTLISDQGLGLVAVEDWLEAWGEYIDYCKFYHITPRLLSQVFVQKKVDVYRSHDVSPMVGGIYLEVAHCQNKVDQAIGWLLETGFSSVEISTNFVEFNNQELRNLISECTRTGLEVFYEYGEKYYSDDKDLGVDEVTEAILSAKDMGASRVIVEESIIDLWLGKDGNGVQADKVLKLSERIEPAHIVWEAGTQAQLAKLILLLGPEVNLGPNIPPELVMWLEPGRRGYGRAFGYPTVVDEYERYKLQV